MTTLGLDHVSLTVPESRQAEVLSFYRDVLGLVELPVPPSLEGRGIRWFRLGADQELHVFPEPMDTPSVPSSGRHPAIRVENLEHVRRSLEAHGLTLHPEPIIPGCERFSLHDPFGNKIELIQRG